MRIQKASILLLYCFLLRIAAIAQLPNYHVQLITEQQGLNTADILDIARDEEGFLWLLSLSSIQQYDGRKAKSFLFSETIRKILIDKNNRKWVLGRSGVYLFKNEFDGFQNIPVAGAGTGASIALFNVDNTVYLLMSDRLLEYDEVRQSFVAYRKPFFSVKTLIADIFGQQKNLFFTASADSIYRIEMGRQSKIVLPFKNIAYLYPINEDEVIVSDWNSRSYRLSFANNSIKEVLPGQIDSDAKSDFIRFFGAIQIESGRFFLSSNVGIVEFNSGTGKYTRPVIYSRGSRLMNNTSIKTFYRDNNGNVFMNHADGLAFFNPSDPWIGYIRNYECPDGSIPDIDIRCFTEDDSGNTWLGTINGIARLNMLSGKIKNYSPSKESNNNYPTIRDILFVDKYIIAGTGSKGIMILNTVTDEFSKPNYTIDSLGRKTSRLLEEDFIWRILKLQQGEILIVGAKNCYLLNPATMYARLAPNPIPSGVSRSAIQDKAGRIWHGTSRGLQCYDSNFKYLFSVVDSFPDQRLASFCEWERDRMLIGGKGLFEVVVNNNSISSFKKIDVLPTARFVYCMQQDAMGNVWLGTDEGLYRYFPQTGAVELLDAADNVQPQAFNSNGLYLAKNNWIFAGGKTGFNYFDPATVKKKIATLHPRVSSLSVGNNDSVFFRESAPFRISYFNRSIIINISAPEYQRPFSLRYRYKLHENDKEWIDNGNSNTIRMHNLPYGRYQFVAAVSYDGIKWFDTTQPIPFIVLKPWWLQWWFRLACLTVLFTMLALIYFYRKKKARHKSYQQAIDYFVNSGHEHSSADDILWDITWNCISRLGFEDCVIYLVDAERQTLKQRAAYGPKSPKLKEIINPIEIPIGKGITGHVAATGKPELVNDVTRDDRYIVDDVVRFSELAVPIVHNDKIIGVIDSEHTRKNFFTKQHLNTLQTIASISASKISLALAVEKMKNAIKEMEVMNTKMLETKFMNLRLQMNPHFLFNSLSSIQHLIVSKQTNEAYKYLSIFSNFIRSILQYADKTFITLDDELKMLEMYIKLESIGFDESFTYKIVVDEDIEDEDIFIPPLILQPLIENAIWHGLLHKQGAKHLSVNIVNNNDEQLLCIVEDNGVGRLQAAATRQKNLHSKAYESKSTQLINERLKLLQQKTGKPASMSIEDIELNEAGDTGTRVTIIIPFYNNETI